MLVTVVKLMRDLKNVFLNIALDTMSELEKSLVVNLAARRALTAKVETNDDRLRLDSPQEYANPKTSVEDFSEIYGCHIFRFTEIPTFIHSKHL